MSNQININIIYNWDKVHKHGAIFYQLIAMTNIISSILIFGSKTIINHHFLNYEIYFLLLIGNTEIYKEIEELGTYFKLFILLIIYLLAIHYNNIKVS
jgi:hypothetical protein